MIRPSAFHLRSHDRYVRFIVCVLVANNGKTPNAMDFYRLSKTKLFAIRVVGR